MADTQQDYREPTEQERESLCSGSPEWIGKEIDVFWDGDNVYYPAVIVRVADGPHKITVQYENTEGEFDEDLSATPWRIWASAQPRPKADPVKANHGSAGSTKAPSGKPSYSAMVMDAITNMNEKNGSSLVAIRKYIQTNFSLKQQQTASFNSLTLKALQKLLALDQLEKVGSSFRVSNAEKERKKQEAKREQQALRIAERNAAKLAAKAPAKLKAAKKKTKAKAKIKSKSKRASMTPSKGPRDEFSDKFYGTAAENNRYLRKELIDARNKRDKYLEKRLSLLLPFLPEKHYFLKKAKNEAVTRKQREIERLERRVVDYRNKLRQQELREQQSIFVGEFTEEQANAEQKNQIELDHLVHQPGGLVEKDNITIFSGTNSIPAQHDGPTDEFAGSPSFAGTLGSTTTVQSTQDLSDHRELSFVNKSSAPTLQSEVLASNSTIKDGADMDVAISLNAPDEGKETSKSREARRKNESEVYSLNTLQTLEQRLAKLHEELREIKHAALTPSSSDPVGQGSDSDAVISSTEIAASASLLSMDTLPKVDLDASAQESSLDILDDKSIKPSNVPLLIAPPTLKADLHEHQIVGISWMVHMFQQGMPMLLGDQMGLGKTIQSIGFLAYLHHTLGKSGPHLIVVPLSVLSNWIAEIEKFCPSLRAIRFHGPKNERLRIITEELCDLKEFDILVTTYEILVSEANFFRRKFVWTSVIVDEGHRLKNDKSQFSEKLRNVPALCKVILTGTPLQNNLRELWAMLHYLVPDVFPAASAEKFEEGFNLARGHIDSNKLRLARKLLSVFMLRRVKDQVQIRLPSRRELTLLVPLTDQQVAIYKQLICGLDSSTIEAVMRESEAALEKNGASSANAEKIAEALEPNSINTGGCSVVDNNLTGPSKTASDGEWRKLMNLLLQLRKVCNHTYLMPDVAPDPYEITEDIVSGSGKLLMLDRMLPRLKADSHRVLIFSQFTSMLDLLEDYCELREYSFVRLDGETNRVKRRLDVRRFNAPNSSLFIFLISTRAGGLGLNLATADTVILYDSDWNPQVDLQAMERAHRIGQTKPVRVYRLVCQGSVEERMVSRAEKKLFLNAMVAEVDPDEELHESGDGAGNDDQLQQALGVGGASISKGELASLIRFGANAVFEGSSNEGGSTNYQISDEELDDFLERQGRDKPSLRIAVGANDVSNVDALEEAQFALKSRMDKLKEVDLRQLGATVYNKKKAQKRKVSTTGDPASMEDNDPNLLYGKRARKDRVIMMDGKGTGYGGSVPVLADTMDGAYSVAIAAPTSTRNRVWVHQQFCVLCGYENSPQERKLLEAALISALAEKKEALQKIAEKQAMKDKKAEKGKKNVKKVDKSKQSKKKASKTETAKAVRVEAAKLTELEIIEVMDSTLHGQEPLQRCAHCPLVFHSECASKCEIVGKTTGMFVCPHHKCSNCGRNTASAGGMLFRCTGCITAYCEDCLPQEEIDSLGRCKAFERLGYDSKQSYFIRCPSCCYLDGYKASGVLGNATNVSSIDTVSDSKPKIKLSEGMNDELTTNPSALKNVESCSKLSIESGNFTANSEQDNSSMMQETESGAEDKDGENGENEEENEEELEEVEEPLVQSKTQKVRLKWEKREFPEYYMVAESVPDLVDESDAGATPTKELKKECKSKKSEIALSIEQDPVLLLAKNYKMSKSLTLSTAYNLFCSHPVWQKILSYFSEHQEAAMNKLSQDITAKINDAMAGVTSKIDAGRYRTVKGFVGDLQHTVEFVVAKSIAKTPALLFAEGNVSSLVEEVKAEKARFNTYCNCLVEFLIDKVEPRVSL